MAKPAGGAGAGSLTDPKRSVLLGGRAEPIRRPGVVPRYTAKLGPP